MIRVVDWHGMEWYVVWWVLNILLYLLTCHGVGLGVSLLDDDDDDGQGQGVRHRSILIPEDKLRQVWDME